MAPEPAQQALDWEGRKRNQRTALLEALLDLQWHTSRELDEQLGPRFGARLHELREEGYDIEDEWLGHKPDGKRWRLRDARPHRPRRNRRVRVYLPEQAARALLKGEVTLPARQAILKGLDSHDANERTAGRRK